MKYVFMLVAVAAISHTAPAQKNKNDKTRYGIKAGYNFIHTFNVPAAQASNTTGFHAGVFASGKDDVVDASADLLFSKQGYRYKNGTVDLNYVTTTETADFFIAEEVFKLQVGVTIGYLFSAKADSSGVAFNSLGKRETDYFNRFTFGVVGGAEYITESGLSLGVRYTIGINNLNKKAGSNILAPPFVPPLSSTGLKSNILQLYIAFRF